MCFWRTAEQSCYSIRRDGLILYDSLGRYANREVYLM